MRTYRYSENDGAYAKSFEAEDDEAAQVWGTEYLADGSYDDFSGWVTGYVVEIDEDGEAVGERLPIRALIEPPDPKCTEAEAHEWVAGPGGCDENPGVFGIGGSAILGVETCRHCGIERHTVSGDSNPIGAGNRDGVTYHEGTPRGEDD